MTKHTVSFALFRFALVVGAVVLPHQLRGDAQAVVGRQALVVAVRSGGCSSFEYALDFEKDRREPDERRNFA